LGLAFLLDYLDNTISSASQLSATISLPLMAVIPRHHDASSTEKKKRGPLGPASEFDLITCKDPRAIVSEAYRELRTAILLSNPGEPPRRLMVTSALPEEGKTATATNLAIALSQLGRRVVLVDTDLRRPRLHKALRQENKRGISTYLSGLEQDPCMLTVETGIENLELMPSGPIPPNPSELLDSDRFRQLADALLASGYDHVIFDSPPALSVSDPAIIASNVDVGILVVRAGKTPRQSIRLAAEKFRHGNEKMGVVLNDLDADRQGAAYYRYQYYGRYGEDSGSDNPVRAGESGA
jgi:succinoglycan biosynthesis transport protein ExoP